MNEEKPKKTKKKATHPNAMGVSVTPNFVPTPEKPLPSVQCVGIVRNGERKGERCDQWAPFGSTVCQFHGYTMPSVKAKAAERVEMARAMILGGAEDAAAEILRLMQFGMQENIRLAAAKDILDRAGLKAANETKVTVEHTVKASELVTDRLKEISKRVSTGEATVTSEVTSTQSGPENSDSDFTSEEDSDIIDVDEVTEDEDTQTYPSPPPFPPSLPNERTNE